MILVSGKKYILLSFAALAGALSLGIIGYLYMVPFEKITAERFLFICLLITLTLGTILGFILFRSKNITKEMDRLIHLSSIGGFTQGTSLKKFGDLGLQISELYYHLSLMNKKRALKISSQKILLDFITANFHLPLLVTDPPGGILYVSKTFTDMRAIKKSTLINSSISTLLPGIDIQVLLSKLTIAHTFFEYEDTRDPVKIYPISNSNNEIAYLVFIFGKQVLFFSEKKIEKERSIHSFLKKLVSRHTV